MDNFVYELRKFCVFILSQKMNGTSKCLWPSHTADQPKAQNIVKIIYHYQNPF